MANLTKKNAPAFPEVRSEINFPRDEAKVLAFWKEKNVFASLLEERKKGAAETFVFYEGPPTANGMPHNGSALTRVMKDIFPRYQTMLGKYVPRKAGWDTHGLPVEVEVEKELRIHGKKAIEEYGVGPFTDRCIESVFRYTKEWESLTDRIGFWIDLPDAYVTFHRSYVESVWWALQDLFTQGLLYRGHKVVWWWAQGGTALSSGEVGLGYRDVEDPSAYVAFPLQGHDGYALLAWTTTPWTLPSNSYAAVHPELDYAYATFGERKLVVAAALVDAVAAKLKTEAVVEKTVKGAELVGTAYVPPFDGYARLYPPATVPYWRVIAAPFVSLEAGTGVVHVAPAFGEDDFAAHRGVLASWPDGERVPLLCAVQPDGTFGPEFPAYAGRWIKDCDRDILQELTRTGALVHRETYRHDYPFCWRADDDPLVQYARPTWYIRTTSRLDRVLANNQAVDWHPETIRDGRFGDFLANNVDWALSRERYWGTPLPIWQNEALPEEHPDRYVAVGSLRELRGQHDVNLDEVERALRQTVSDPEKCEHLLVHKPWIDQVTFTRPGVAGVYRRVPEVIDCWFDSGCMPFAQWGFPHQPGSEEKFRQAFPANFICEAVDQTRGWFYSLLMVSTLLFDEAKQKRYQLAGGGELPHPYRTCLVLGHVCDKSGKKESKSKGNYTPPEVILERVRMEFAVVTSASLPATVSVKEEPGVAWIAREDLEGLDVKDGQQVHVYGVHERAEPRTLELRAAKGLPRRVVVLASDDAAAFGVVPNAQGLDVMAAEVPRLPADQRVWIEDPSMPAPGADAFRWFFLASSPPWTNTRHSLSNVRTLQKDFLVKLRNVFSFFTIYANIDGWSPPPLMTAGEKHEPTVPRLPEAQNAFTELDRWILSELALLARDVGAHLDRYESFEAAQKLSSFVESLSNWYVRRSRERFWAPGLEPDKHAAYGTLYHCLVTLAKLTAPFVPFLAEELYQALVVAPGQQNALGSVHMERYPTPETVLAPFDLQVDGTLCSDMNVVRELVSLGLQVRTTAKLKVRQPLAGAEIVLNDDRDAKRIAEHTSLFQEELNVKKVSFLVGGQEHAKAVRYRVKPNFRALGPKVGKHMPAVKAKLAEVDGSQLRAAFARQGSFALEVAGTSFDLTPEEVEIVVEAQEGFAAAGGAVGVMILHTALDEALVHEGVAREIQSRLQAMRRELNLGFTERVRVAVEGAASVAAVVQKHADMLAQNVLIDGGVETALPSFDVALRAELTLDDETVTLSLGRTEKP